MAVSYNFAGPRIVKDGLVLYLDAGNPNSYNLSTPNVWRDISKNGNNGSLVNGPVFDSANGGSIVFDGSNDYAVISNSSSLNMGSKSFTGELWVSIPTFNGVERMLFEYNIWGANGTYQITTVGNTVRVNFPTAFSAGKALNYSYSGLTSNTWVHIVGQLDSINNKLNLYINGYLVAEMLSVTEEIGNVTNSLYIMSRGGTSLFLPSKLSTLRIYNRALSQAEITQNFNATKGRFGMVLDPDATNYFSHAEALGGSFDQSAINPTYSEAYVKNAISDMIVGLKADAVWDKLIELYLMAGVTFDGLMAKVKHAGTATLTNTSNNFVAADYIAAGSGAGLKGNGSNKTLTTTKTHGTLGSMGIYRTVRETSGGAPIGEDDGAGSNRLFMDSFGAGGATRYYYGGTVGVNGNTDNGFLAVSRVSSTSLRAYRNTVVAGANGSGITLRSNATTSIGLFCKAFPGSLQNQCNLRMSFAYVAEPLDDTEALNLSARVNTLMTALGCNVF
jgi:hypothetical protein